MKDPKDAIASFWRYFQDHSKDLEALTTADAPEYDAMLSSLQKIHPKLFFEFCISPPESDFVITAEGRRDLFDLVERIVAQAPEVAGWRMTPLKPKLGFPEAATWDDYRVDIANVVFEPMTRGSGELKIQMYIPDLDDDDAENAHNALLRAIGHALGEREFAENIDATDVAPLPEGASADKFIPLEQLEAFLAWRKKKRNG